MNEEKEEMFLDELSYIKNDDYADALLNIINMLPDYWLTEAASSTSSLDGMEGAAPALETAIEEASAALFRQSSTAIPSSMAAMK